MEPSRPRVRSGPMRILWNARWEHDKNPELFFETVSRLRRQNIDFRLIVLGKAFRSSPLVFDQSRVEFAEIIDHWGYAQTRAEYVERLHQADVVVSTADHEFFGIGIVEAICAGAFPILPNRLAYPELLRELRLPELACLYDGSGDDLLNRLINCQEELRSGQVTSWLTPSSAFGWSVRARDMDRAIEEVGAGGSELR